MSREGKNRAVPSPTEATQTTPCLGSVSKQGERPCACTACAWGCALRCWGAHPSRTACPGPWGTVEKPSAARRRLKSPAQIGPYGQHTKCRRGRGALNFSSSLIFATLCVCSVSRTSRRCAVSRRPSFISALLPARPAASSLGSLLSASRTRLALEIYLAACSSVPPCLLIARTVACFVLPFCPHRYR